MTKKSDYDVIVVGAGNAAMCAALAAREHGVSVAVLECAPDVARVWVLDRGPGIPAALREAVFRPFHRLEGSRARDTGGSGLGLAIARQLADAYGWRIELADREGGGLAASLIIPRRPAPSALPPPGSRA